MPEILDLYDRNGVRTGETLIRGTKVPAGRRVLIVSIVTLNSSGEILLTRRAEGKTYAGCWEITGGCVQSGEDAREAALRELYEETGIRALPDEIIHCGTRMRTDYIHEFYRVHKDIPITGIRLQPGETDDARWVTPEEFRRMAQRRMTIAHQTAFFFECYPDIFGTADCKRGT